MNAFLLFITAVTALTLGWLLGAQHGYRRGQADHWRTAALQAGSPSPSVASSPDAAKRVELDPAFARAVSWSVHLDVYAQVPAPTMHDAADRTLTAALAMPIGKVTTTFATVGQTAQSPGRVFFRERLPR